MTIWWIYPVLGMVAGILSGLLGIGGGLLLVAAMILLLPLQGVPVEIAVPVALASSLASIIVTGLASSRAHHQRGAVLWKTVAWLVPGMLLGSVLASIGVVKWAGPELRWAVIVYCVLIAVQLLSQNSARVVHPEKSSTGVLWTALGIVIGAVSSVVGIGGGSMTVPALTWRGVPMVRAVATSAVCGVFIALASAFTYSQMHNTYPMPDYSFGFVYLPASFGVAITSIWFAPLGAKWAHQKPAKQLKRGFACFLLVMAILLIVRT
jgi:uncharacterized membrane protein YfcA